MERLWSQPPCEDKQVAIDRLRAAIEYLQTVEQHSQRDWEQLLMVVHRHIRMFEDHAAFVGALQEKLEDCCSKWVGFNNPFADCARVTTVEIK